MKCPKCQMNINDSSKVCLHCGTQFNNNYEQDNNATTNNCVPMSGVTQESMNYPVTNTQNVVQSQTTKPNFRFLILSIINMVVFFPTVLIFSGLWLLFGALGNSLQYWIMLLLSSGYILVSLICLFLSIWNFVKKNKTLKKIVIVIVFILVLFIVGGIFYYRFFPNSTRKFGEYVDKLKSGSLYQIKGKIVYQDNDIVIKVNRIHYNSDEIELNFILENKSNLYYNFSVKSLKINDIDMHYNYERKSNFSSTNYWVEPEGKSDNYYLNVLTNNLNEKNINISQANKISFQFILYSDINGVNPQNSITTDYCDIEIKS